MSTDFLLTAFSISKVSLVIRLTCFAYQGFFTEGCREKLLNYDAVLVTVSLQYHVYSICIQCALSGLHIGSKALISEAATPTHCYTC